MHRIFCATPWELEAERIAFQDAVGRFNETVAMPRATLFVPVSLANIRDKRPLQYTVDENISQCGCFVLVLSEKAWGPVERDFSHDHRFALQCLADPTLPMQTVAVLQKSAPDTPEAAPDDLPAPTATFSSGAEFDAHLFEILTSWLDSLAAPPASLKIVFREESPADDAFVRHLVLTTIALELGASAWPEPMRSNLLAIQHDARRQTVASPASGKIIVADDIDAGWIVTATLSDSLYIADFMILPEMRNRGIGTAVLRHLFAMAAGGGKSVRLGVNTSNEAAIRFYERLGMARVTHTPDSNPLQYVMEWHSGSAADTGKT